MSMPILREYQARSVAAGRDVVRSGKRRFVLYAPTGAGKTTIGMAFIAGVLAKGKRVAFVANRITLVGQASAQLSKAGIDHGVIQGQNTFGSHKPCIVCSIQTVARRGPRRAPSASVILVSERHFHSRAKIGIEDFHSSWNFRSLCPCIDCMVACIFAIKFDSEMAPRARLLD
jgi:superfamily II DNA or RNA helicase